MNDHPAFRELGKIAARWRDLTEKRREYFAELYRSGCWKRYYEEEEELLARIREVAEIRDRWAVILEQHQRALREFEAPAIDRDAA